MALILQINEFEILCEESGNYDLNHVVDDLSAYEHDEEVMELAEDVADTDWEILD